MDSVPNCSQKMIKTRLPSRWLLAVGLLVSLLIPSGANCQDSSTPDDNPEQPAAFQSVTFGIAGHYRLGHWTAVRIHDGKIQKLLPAGSRVNYQTLDGDGVAVNYQYGELQSGQFSYVIPGSEAAPLRVLTADGKTVLETRFPIQRAAARGAAMIPLGMPWVVAIGDTLGIEKIGENDVLKRDASVAVSVPTVQQFPDKELGYHGVDLVLINSAGHEKLMAISTQQREALKDWILGGGKVLLAMGAKTPELAKAAPWLIELLPTGDEPLTVRSMNPSAFETYTSSQDPLAEFKGAVLPRDRGEVLITGRTTRRLITPMAVEYGIGFGHIIVVTADLDGEELSNWSERMDLVKRLTGSLLTDKEEVTGNRATSFNDLGGQMRASLDQFPGKRSFPFSVVAIILMLLIMSIGPLDYLLVNRVLGRPILGWISFPIMVIGLSAFLIILAKSRKNPGEQALTDISMNHVEIVDIDMLNKVGRGFSWGYLYSHPASQMDADVASSGALSQVSSKVDSMLLAPYGIPGSTFGGIQISGQDTRFPTYDVSMETTDQTTTSSIRGLSLAPRSSKSLATWTRFSPKLSMDVRMQRRKGSDTLHGTLTNPLSADLLDGMLIYRNWVYLLPTRFPAGSSIKKVADLRQKPFKWQLTKRKALEKSRTDNEDWIASSFDDPGRIAEILMFNRAAGSERYTSLKNDALSFLDLSDALTQDRCMLFGRVRDTNVELALQSAGDQNNESIESVKSRLSFVRLVMPVVVDKSKR